MEQVSLLVSRQQTAALLGCSVRFVDYLVARGELPARRLGRRVLISRRAVEVLARCDPPRPTEPLPAPALLRGTA